MRSTNTSPIALVFACLFAVLLGTVATNFDFRAFYCAGSVANQHGNPYTIEPLHSCERALPGDPFKPYSRTTALPAPLPGYAIALFEQFARLPFVWAARVWTVVLSVAVVAVIALTMSLTGLSAGVISFAFLLPLCAASLGLGEVVPIFVASACAAALFVRQQRWLWAALAAAGTLIEPHVGIPVVLSLAIWAPRARRPLLAICAVLFIVSVATIGLSENLDYVLRILPAHAISEVGSDAQLSFSVILYAMGAGVSAAIAMGTVSYVLACTLGIALGGALAKRFGSQGFIIVTPAAMSLIGGSFIHVTQMAAALPFVLLLWTAAPRYRAAILPALLLLAVPWRIVGSPLLMTVAATVVLYLAWEMSARNARVSLAAGAGAVMCMLALNVWMAAPPMQSRAVAHYASRIDNTYAEASWARYNEEYLSTGAPERWWRRAPTWFGLLLIGGSAIAATTRRDNRPAVLQAAADA